MTALEHKKEAERLLRQSDSELDQYKDNLDWDWKAVIANNLALRAQAHATLSLSVAAGVNGE
jgi:hypothetical protein